MKIFSKFLILLLTVVSVFSIKNVSADTPDIVIKDMSISEKSDTIVVNDYGFNGTTMNSDVTFYDIGDYVTYKVVLKNNTNKTYSINGLTDNNENNNVTYEYNSNEEKVLEANKELDIYITVKYTEELAPGDVSVATGNIDIVLDMSEVINPITNDNIIITLLVVVLAASLAMILFFKNKKVKYLSIAIFVISSMLIVKTAVAKETFKLTINSKYSIVKTSTFKTGKEVNLQMKRMAGMSEGYDWYDLGDTVPYYFIKSSEFGYYYNRNIISVVKASQEEYDGVKDGLNEEHIVSTEDSRYPIYMWYSDGVIYYYSEADKLYLNSDASCMFFDLEKVTSIDVSSFDTSKVINMSQIFHYCMELPLIDVSGFDTSNVTDMNYMFSDCRNLMELNLSNFDTSKVTCMFSIFAWCEKLIRIDLSSFDTSKVTNMGAMFTGSRALTKIDVTGFNTSNVTNMGSMFMQCVNLTDLDVSGFDVSQVTNMSWMFAWTSFSRDIISTWVIPDGCNTNNMFD